jgi:methyltransferase family protein
MADVNADALKHRVRRLESHLPATRPLISGVRRIRRRLREWRLRVRDQQTLRALKGRTDLRLNIGSNVNHLPGWLNIDLRRDEVCFGMDATMPWPFESGSAEAINSEQLIEHLTLDQVPAYLWEAFRVLHPGGLLRTTTPNLTSLCETFLERDPRTLEVHR